MLRKSKKEQKQIQQKKMNKRNNYFMVDFIALVMIVSASCLFFGPAAYGHNATVLWQFIHDDVEAPHGPLLLKKLLRDTTELHS